jgi:hypothetical protein
MTIWTMNILVLDIRVAVVYVVEDKEEATIITIKSLMFCFIPSIFFFSCRLFFRPSCQLPETFFKSRQEDLVQESPRDSFQ